MEKMMTYSQKSYIEDLAAQAGKADPEYFINEHFGFSRSMNATKKVTMSQASQLINELIEEIG